jgi:hypothetical protein
LLLKRVLGGVAALAVAGGLAAVGAGPASAAPVADRAAVDRASSRIDRCTVQTLTTTRGWTTTDGGVVRIAPGGVTLRTPTIPSAVEFRQNLSPRVRLADVRELSYRTIKLDGTTVDGVPIAPGNNAALPAYRLWLDADNDGDTDGALVFEPYWQAGVGTPPRGGSFTTWDVDAGIFWTSSAVIPGIAASAGGGDATQMKTLAQIRTSNPNARVVGYGIGQGTYNAGTVALLNAVRFDGGRTCTTTNWKTPERPSWRVLWDAAQCGDRYSEIRVVNTGHINIAVRFTGERTETVRPGRSADKLFRSGKVEVFVNGREVAEYRHRTPNCRPMHAGGR